MAKATTHPTCTPTNLNIRTRSSTLYANAPILLASILLNFRRRPESHLQLQVSEKLAISDDRQVCHIYERFQDSDAFLAHLQLFNANFAARFFEILKPTRLVIYGEPSVQL